MIMLVITIKHIYIYISTNCQADWDTSHIFVRSPNRLLRHADACGVGASATAVAVPVVAVPEKGGTNPIGILLKPNGCGFNASPERLLQPELFLSLGTCAQKFDPPPPPHPANVCFCVGFPGISTLARLHKGATRQVGCGHECPVGQKICP